jgi:hypothetical protein
MIVVRLMMRASYITESWHVLGPRFVEFVLSDSSSGFGNRMDDVSLGAPKGGQ